MFCDGYYPSALTIKEDRSRAGSVGNHRGGMRKMGRKPKYENPQSIIDTFFASVSDSYRHPGSGDEVGDVPGRKKQELLAEEFEISRIKVRKILITTGDITPPAAITSLSSSGLKIEEIAQKLNMSKSTVNSWVGYSKGVYKLSEVSAAAADRTKIYRARKEALQTLHADPSSLNLWSAICLFAGYPFITSGRGSALGKKFKYSVAEAGGAGGHHYNGEEVEGFGNELFIVQNGEKREKGISRSSVDYAFKIATTSTVTGPKALKIYGSSYVYSLFVRFGLVTPAE